MVLAVVRMRLARQLGDLEAVAGQAQQLLAPAGDAAEARLGLGEDLRALALINLGIAELWTGHFEEADRRLEQGIALAHRIGRPFLEITGLAHWAQLLSWRSFPLGAQRSREAIELAGRRRLDRGARRQHGTWRSAWRWSPRDGSRRGNGRSSRPSGRFGPRSNRRPG